jgi:hypothetical protein
MTIVSSCMVTRQQRRAEERAEQKLSEQKSLMRKTQGEPQVICPICNETIHPRTTFYIPIGNPYRQYRCEHCHQWLMLDFKSRILFAIVMAPIIMAIEAPILATAIYGHLSANATVVVMLALLGVITFAFRNVIGVRMRRIAKWKASPY